MVSEPVFGALVSSSERLRVNVSTYAVPVLLNLNPSSLGFLLEAAIPRHSPLTAADNARVGPSLSWPKPYKFLILDPKVV